MFQMREQQGGAGKTRAQGQDDIVLFIDADDQEIALLQPPHNTGACG